MKPKNYYSRYDHYFKIPLSEVGSFRTIKQWLKGRKRILDVGCGVGHLTNFWGAIGVDNDPKALSLAQKKFPETEFVLADATCRLPFKDGFFEAVVCYNVLEHIPDQSRDKVFQEIERVLSKRKGLVICGYVDEDYWLNRLTGRFFPSWGYTDPTHLVSWKSADFEREVAKYLKIVDKKRTSPYGKLIFLSRYWHGELLIKARSK